MKFIFSYSKFDLCIFYDVYGEIFVDFYVFHSTLIFIKLTLNLH